MLRFRFAFLFLAVLILGAPTLTYAQDFTATLNGYQESPSVSTDASGNFEADLDETTNEISYTLSYNGIATPVAFAHLHFARFQSNGGIIVWLCDNTGSPDAPAGTQACPEEEGEITGTIGSADVVGPEDQGIAAGEFAELVAAIRAVAVYVNVHTEAFAAGEIRGQLLVTPPPPPSAQ